MRKLGSMPEQTDTNTIFRFRIQIQPQCGACLDTFQVNERIIARKESRVCKQSDTKFSVVFRRNDCIEIHDAHRYTIGSYCEQGSERGANFRRTPSGKHRLAKEAKTATIHADCLALFSQHYTANDKFYRLWQASISISPWHYCKRLVLPYNVDSDDLTYISKILNMPQLQSLPAEIKTMINIYTGLHLVRRYRVVIERAAIIEESSTRTSPKRVLLCDVQSWDRQSSLLSMCCNNSEVSPPNFLLVTIDSCGIKKIERIDSPELATQSKTTPFQLFIVEKATALTSVEAVFKSGYCRLIKPKEVHLTICNMPFFSNLSDKSIRLITITQPQLRKLHAAAFKEPHRLLHAIDTRFYFGIPFFFRKKSVVAIHSHAANSPSAVETFLRLPPHYQRDACWIYVPLPEGEEITEYGLKVPDSDSESDESHTTLLPCFYVNTKLHGLIEIGQALNKPFKVYKFHPTQPRPVFIYDIQSNCWSIAEAGYKKEAASISTTQELIKQPPFPSSHFSTASLEGVSLVYTFIDTSTQFCVGFILEYDNGTSKSLGQCRVGVDDLYCFQRPSRLCYAKGTVPSPLGHGMTREGLILDFGKLYPCNHHDSSLNEEMSWSCYKMKGNVECWFTFKATELFIIN